MSSLIVLNLTERKGGAGGDGGDGGASGTAEQGK